MNTYTNIAQSFKKVQTGYTMVVLFGISLNNKTFGKNWEKNQMRAILKTWECIVQLFLEQLLR